MPRYAAFLRGVSPMNAAMPELKRGFEAAGFIEVKTVLGSGNVVFTAEKVAVARLQSEAEAAMEKHLDRTFLMIVRKGQWRLQGSASPVGARGKGLRTSRPDLLPGKGPRLR